MVTAMALLESNKGQTVAAKKVLVFNTSIKQAATIIVKACVETTQNNRQAADHLVTENLCT
jgi:hypothetical protein